MKVKTIIILLMVSSVCIYNLSARYYNPVAGRFLTADTVTPGGGADLQGLNRYSYCTNNPVKYTDPTGHEPVQTEYIGYSGILISFYATYSQAAQNITRLTLPAAAKGLSIGGRFMLAGLGLLVPSNLFEKSYNEMAMNRWVLQSLDLEPDLDKMDTDELVRRYANSTEDDRGKYLSVVNNRRNYTSYSNVMGYNSDKIGLLGNAFKSYQEKHRLSILNGKVFYGDNPLTIGEYDIVITADDMQLYGVSGEAHTHLKLASFKDVIFAGKMIVNDDSYKLINDTGSYKLGEEVLNQGKKYFEDRGVENIITEKYNK